ncbi:collagen binding domain-containing protein [Streptomyces sp. NPDC020597]|uniref:MSCRAMM family protein n=1 Tax=unclassified Streptomyces TaxID=2593676 RepID=UPI00379FC99F
MSPAQTRSGRIEEGAAAPRVGVALAVPAFVAVAGVILVRMTGDLGGGALPTGGRFDMVMAAGAGAAILALAVAAFLPGRRTATTAAPAASCSDEPIAPSCVEPARTAPVRTAPARVEPARVEPASIEPSGEQPGVGTAGEARAAGAAVAVPLARAVAELVATVPGLDDGGPAAGGRAVRGRVRGAEGLPVAGAAVTLISLGGRQVGRAVCGLDGSYELTPGTGAYVLIASADGHQPQAATVVVGAASVQHDVLLSSSTGLVGAVRSTGDGAPLAGAVVVVMDVHGDVLATSRTDGKGEFTVADLVPGDVVLAVSSPGRRPLAQPVEIGVAGATRVDVELRPGTQVRGTVRAAGAPACDARVTLVDAAGNVVATATTGGDGTYAFTDLDEGPYTVIASGYPPRADDVSLGGADVSDHDIELAHTT